MRFCTFLALTVPIVTTYSFAPAWAGGAGSSGDSWLKDSIATLSAKTQTAPKVAHAKPAPGAVKLRPFVPNRYLPRESDLQQALVAQQARMDNASYSAAAMPDATQQLSGQVSVCNRPSSPYDRYAMPAAAGGGTQALAVSALQQIGKAVAKRAPRLVPGQTPIMPEQFNQANMVNPFPEPPAQCQTKAHFPLSVSAPVPSGLNNSPAQQLSQQPARLQLPAMSPQQQAELQRLVANNPPKAHMDFNGDVIGAASDNPSNGIGQPPFPLNISPGSPMQAMMANRRRTNAPQARFGSWHDNSGLCQAGFHTYLPYRKPTAYEYVQAPLAGHKRQANVHNISKAKATTARQGNQHILTQNIATYPVYFSARGTAY